MAAPVFYVTVSMHPKLRRVQVCETDTIASLRDRCSTNFRHYFAKNSLRVFRNGVDLATLNQQSTLADVDIDETTELRVEADTSNNITSTALSLLVKK
jgi:hypothetical protein